MRRHGPVVTAGVVIEVCDDLLTNTADLVAIAALLSEGLRAATNIPNPGDQ